MSIRIVPSPTFSARVPFTVPGESEPAWIDFEFRHKAPEALRAWLESRGDRSVSEALSDVVVRWKGGVIDEDGSEVVYSPAALSVFLSSHAPRAQELARAYIAEITESRLKNSERLQSG